ncbi:MAG: hypothetical protein Q9195_004513 [Heterodermia aff. obscurata]
MSETPALPPPDGFFSDFENPVSQKRSLTIINSVVPCVMLVFASVYFYTRKLIHQSMEMDDRSVTSLRQVLAISPCIRELTQDSILEINIGIVCGAAVCVRAFFSDHRNGVKGLVSRLGNRWTDLDPNINSDIQSPVHPDQNRKPGFISRMEIIPSTKLENILSADEFLGINTLDIVDENLALVDTP